MFRDRMDGGQQLARELLRYQKFHPLVVALPRGGVPVGYEVARALETDLDVIVVRKLGAPGNPEFAIGAIAPGVIEVNRLIVETYGIPERYIDQVIARERAEMERRERRYRSGRAPSDAAGRTVLLIDDGLATGATASAAIASIRKQRPERIVFGAPACACESADDLAHKADEVVCVLRPRDFGAVSLWYHDFVPTTDDDVTECLDRAAKARASVGSDPGGGEP
ncbi:MAG: phosphoribosyltransferase [Gemmatimonadales bacterium]|nr:phosphoribosyltransferase [Gemmatimonadales bacterium]